jgi:hypothetical protein
MQTGRRECGCLAALGFGGVVIDHDALLAAYDALRPWVPAEPPSGLSYEQRGSVLRVVGQHRGFIDTARNVGAQGEALDALIVEQRDFFAQRGESVEWKTRGHDEPPDLPARLLAAGLCPKIGRRWSSA